MKELTVTITLSEYRNLIRGQVYMNKEIELLEEKLKNAQEASKTFMQLLMLRSPETINKLCESINTLFTMATTETEEGEKGECDNLNQTAQEVGV